MDALVELVEVSKAYRDGNVETQVLDRVDVTLTRGELTSLSGVSGSGKSTLLSLIAGVNLPDSGRIVFEGHDVTGLDEEARARLRAHRIGVVLQGGNLIPFLTAKENVELAVELAGGDRTRRAVDALTAVGLPHRLDQLPRRMSGGEAQRVAIAVALVNDPDLLLADEVTAELDSSAAEQVMGVILDAWRQRGLTVLLATHDPEVAARAQRSLVLENGRVQES